MKALVDDVEQFYQCCDPERENLCLYGNQDGTWEVALPAEEVPPEMPEPSLGINFARNGMQRKDWLALVAVHSDTWLLAVAFYNGARLNKAGREALFELINEQPTCFEVVSGKAKQEVRPKKRSMPMSSRPLGPPKAYRPNPRQEDDDEEEEEEGPGSDYADGEGDPCPNCGRVYRAGEFWIACDFCDTWYDGKCVQMTPVKAQRMGRWKCPQCTGHL